MDKLKKIVHTTTPPILNVTFIILVLGIIHYNIRKVGPFINYPILHYLYVPKYLQKSLLILSKEKITTKMKSYLLSRKLVLAIFVLLFAPQKNKN